MLDARQIRDSEFIKNGVKRRAKAEAQQFLERTAGAVEQLQNENASVRAENIELTERNTRLSEMNTKLEEEKEQLLQKLSGAVEFSGQASAPAEMSDLAQDHENASLRAQISELTAYNARLKDTVEKLEDEKGRLLQKLEDKPEANFSQENESASLRSENIELAEYNARLREAVAKLEDEKEQLLVQLDEPKPELDSVKENESAAIRNENSELTEYNTQLKEIIAKLEDEKQQLLQKLAVMQYQPTVKPGSAEAESIIKTAQEKAKLITERAERDYLLKMTRANAAIIQKTIAFEQEFGENLRKLKIADGEVRQLKAQLGKLLEQMPNGLGENTEVLLDRLKNHE